VISIKNNRLILKYLLLDSYYHKYNQDSAWARTSGIVKKAKELIEISCQELILEYPFSSRCAHKYIYDAENLLKTKLNGSLSAAETTECMMLVAIKIAKASLVFFKETNPLCMYGELDSEINSIESKFKSQMPFPDVYTLGEATIEASEKILNFAIHTAIESRRVDCSIQ
jgi:hypothetical protein